MPSRTCAGPSEERPGSVHLELPEDVAGAETDDAYLVPLHALERPVAPEGGARTGSRHDPRRGAVPALLRIFSVSLYCQSLGVSPINVTAGRQQHAGERKRSQSLRCVKLGVSNLPRCQALS